MKKSVFLRSAQIAVATAALAGAHLASAATWNFANNTTTISGANQTSVNVSGFYVNNASTGVINSGSTFTAASLSDQGGSGRGMNTGTDSGSPNHAFDNNGTTEMLSLQFGTKVDLDSVSVGWSSTDADLSVLAYTGSGAATPVAGRTWSQLLANGWSLIGHYAGSGSGTRNINFSNVTSSWWLISAFNSGFGGNSSGLSNHDDYVKLLAVAGSAVSACTPGTPGCGGQQVAEPATLALFGLAALGVVAVRRRNAS
ncbi:MAG: exosortase-dependent surface protein XDP1 [Burkholderiaceae bacterium]